MAELATTEAAPWLLPLIAWLAVALLTGLLAGEIDFLQPLRHVVALLVLLGLRHALPQGRVGPWAWPPIGWGLLAFALWLMLEPLAGESAVEGGAMLSAGLAAMSVPVAVLWLSLRVVGSVLIVPIVEELAFRGYLMRRLTSRNFEGADASRAGWASILVSALAFGALHQRWLAGTLAGLCFALAYRSRGRLSDAIVAHVVANGLVAVSVLLAGRWSLWA